MEDGKAAKDFLFERKVGQWTLARGSDELPQASPHESCNHLFPQVLNGTTLHVRNAPSPAATASLAIAEHVVDVASSDFAWSKDAKKK